MKTKKIIPSALSVAAVLLCLVLVTAHFTSGMYARYVTRAQGSDRGHAAEFDVQATQNKTQVVAGKDGYQITITNDSKVAVSYEAVIRFDNSADEARFEPVQPITGTLAPGAEETSAPIVFALLDADGTGTAPFTVTVTFTQID